VKRKGPRTWDYYKLHETKRILNAHAKAVFTVCSLRHECIVYTSSDDDIASTTSFYLPVSKK